MLTDARVVFVWQRVHSVSKCIAMLRKLFGGRPIGKNGYATIFDAGGALLGFWSQNEFLKSPASTTGRVGTSSPGATEAEALLASNSCGEINYLVASSNPDPTFQLLFDTDNIARIEKISSLLGFKQRRTRSSIGPTVSFFDDSGNNLAFVRLEPTASLPIAAREILDGVAISESAKVRKNQGDSRFNLFGINLQAEDLRKTADFYGDILRIELLEEAAEGVMFKAAKVLLSLKSESERGSVRDLAQKGRFNSDQIVFHTLEIEQAVAELQRLGVRFPHGIESSVTGEMATFFDPDGRALALWRPAGEDSPGQTINFYPALRRILAV